jgi:hypothetical protein
MLLLLYLVKRYVYKNIQRITTLVCLARRKASHRQRAEKNNSQQKQGIEENENLLQE